MKYLSLFTGAGGGELAAQHLLGWECVGYVEFEEYCQKVIKQRIADGLLNVAPTFGDVRAFLSEGYARAISGMVDVVAGGDPCQDNSAAAPKGSPDKSLGAEFIEVVQQIKPWAVFRENPAVVRREAPWPADRFAGALEDLGYYTIPKALKSCCFGGDHKRKRLFVQGITPNADSESTIQAIEEILSERGGVFAWEDAYCSPGRDESLVLGVLSEADICRAPYEVANRLERVRAIGNGIDPFVAATAWRLLSGGLE